MWKPCLWPYPWGLPLFRKCRTNPWLALPDWHSCRNLNVGLTQMNTVINADAGHTFSPHYGIYFVKFFYIIGCSSVEYNVADKGAALLNRVQRRSVGCCEARKGAAKLTRLLWSLIGSALACCEAFRVLFSASWLLLEHTRRSGKPGPRLQLSNITPQCRNGWKKDWSSIGSFTYQLFSFGIGIWHLGNFSAGVHLLVRHCPATVEK